MSFLSDLGLSVAGPLVGGLLGKSSAKSQAKSEAQLSRENWEYQQSNAHQLEVKDLKAAGLNPILSATNSQMANMSPVHASDPANYSGNISSAFQGLMERSLKKDMQSKELEIENKKLENDALRLKIDRDSADAQIEKWKTEGKLNLTTADYYSAKQGWEKNESDARVENIKQQTQNSIEELRSLVSLREKQGYLASSQASYYNSLVDKCLEDIKYAIEQRTGQQLTNEQLIRSLQDPDNAIHRDYRGTWIGNAIGYIGEVVKDISPFKGYSVSNRGLAGRN